jgi:hypothetical protein
MFKCFTAVFALFLISGCGVSATDGQLTPVGTPDADGAVIKARSTFEVSTGGTTTARLFGFVIRSAFAASGTAPASTTLAASTSFSLNSSLFSVPSNPTPFAVNDLGYLQVGTLEDNDLRVCGTNGKTKCAKAFIRMYTTGAAGSGMWNTADGYGAPITAGQGSAFAPVGLNAAGAATVQQITLANNKNTLKLADFADPKYGIQVDFTDAGAGTYATTLVVEYGLSL